MQNVRSARFGTNVISTESTVLLFIHVRRDVEEHVDAIPLRVVSWSTRVNASNTYPNQRLQGMEISQKVDILIRSTHVATITGPIGHVDLGGNRVEEVVEARAFRRLVLPDVIDVILLRFCEKNSNLSHDSEPPSQVNKYEMSWRCTLMALMCRV